MESFSSVAAINGLLSKSARISSSEPVAMKPGSSPVSLFWIPASARRKTVAGSLRLRSMRTLTMPRLSISNSSHDPRAGIRLAMMTCLVASLAAMTYAPGDRTSWVTMTRSVPLMMKVPCFVIMGKSPMKTFCSRISPVTRLTNRTVMKSGAAYVMSLSRHSARESGGSWN